MEIRRATPRDIPRLHQLLEQVNLVHHLGRPDLFRIGTKYTHRQLEDILADDSRPVLVAVDEAGQVAGYAFCLFERCQGDNIRTDIRTLYLDDLCVDESARGGGVGRRLYEAVEALARERGCYNVTLNVWSCNEKAMGFYAACGLKPQKVCMERIL